MKTKTRRDLPIIYDIIIISMPKVLLDLRKVIFAQMNLELLAYLIEGVDADRVGWRARVVVLVE